MREGALDRDRMRALAFADPRARRRLEADPAPADRRRDGAPQRGRAGDAVLVFDVPLLVESARWRDRVERVLVVDCSSATQIERVAQRPAGTGPRRERVVAQQASRALRRAIADAVVFNDGIDLAALEAQVVALWRRWTAPG